MNGMADHAKTTRGNHLWVLAVIAAAAAIPVGAGWVGLGSIAGFPVIFGKSTGWTLVVSLEAYGGYAVYIWLGGAPGDRSRRFGQWSAIGVLALSLIGQGSYHLMLAEHALRLPAFVVVFAACLPVVVLTLAAILMHLCHADARANEDAAVRAAESERHAAIMRAENDERAALRSELEAARQAVADAGTARREAEDIAAGESERADENARKLADAEAKIARMKAAKNNGGSKRTNPRTTVPDDVDVRAEALTILAADPDVSGAELGRRLGMTPRWGQQRKQEYAGHVTGPGSGESD